MQEENLEDYGFGYDVKMKSMEDHVSKEERGFIGGISVKPVLDSKKKSSS